MAPAELRLGKIGQLGRFVAIVKKLVQGNLEGAREFFQRFHGRHGVPVFDARDIAAEQAGPLFNFALREFLLFPQNSQSVADNHGWLNLRS